MHGIGREASAMQIDGPAPRFERWAARPLQLIPFFRLTAESVCPNARCLAGYPVDCVLQQQAERGIFICRRAIAALDVDDRAVA